MNIQPGNYYRTRDGRRVGPAVLNKGAHGTFPWACGQYTYTNAGHFFAGGKESVHDLISEWPSLSSASILPRSSLDVPTPAPAGLKLEEGKSYRSRDGSKIGPMVEMKAGVTGDWRFMADVNGKTIAWRLNGIHSIFPGRDHPLDLVEEWHGSSDVPARLVLAEAPIETADRAQTFEERERDLLAFNVRTEQRARDAEARVRDLTALIAGKAEEQGDRRIVLDLEGGLPDRWDSYAAAGTFFLGADARPRDRAKIAADFADAMMAEREKRGRS